MLGSATFMSSPAGAQSAAWPERSIRLIVGYPAGGGADTVARLFAPLLSKQVGQPVVVENRAGASGSIGIAAVMQSPPDGYTLFIAASSEMTIAPAVGKVSYDPERDLKPVALLGSWPYVLVAAPSFPPNSIAELIAYSKTNPGKLSFSSFGANSVTHLTGELFKSLTGVDAVHVAYKGSAPSIADVMGGQVQFTFDSPVSTLKLVHAGKLKALAVTSNERLKGAADIPTTREAGVPELLASAWIGLLAPANTPTAIVDRLNAEARKALESPELREAFESRIIEPGGGSPDDLGKIISSQLGQWRLTAKRIGIKND
jgi:tripartite-type tricarboxylate transporter receptor subunit TctC